jgi:pyridoxal phosphate enzyme (YggS family)
MTDARERIRTNIDEVRARMAAAARRVGRDPDDIRLVAVTKYVNAEVTRWLVEAGCQALGESRPQSLLAKANALPDLPIEWHLIGHLQRNKIRRTLPHLQWLHSVDSIRLLDALEEEAARQDRQVRVLLDVNISGDDEKTGFAERDVIQLPTLLVNWPHVSVGGLMAMSARESDPEAAREDFARLRELRDSLQRQCPSEVQLAHLSMGMSRDYEVAIEEGATMVRVGSSLFEGVVE